MPIPYVEIIDAATADPNLLMWKFEDEDKEIKNGAKLIVRESQQVLMLSEGKLADVFGPGMHSLSTKNIPILSALKGWKYGFESPYKVDIYFLNTHQFINNKWGTPAPIIMQDAKFGQVRIRAFGSFDVKIDDVSTFFKQYAGTYKQLTIFELQNQLRDFIAPKFGEVLQNEKMAVMDVAGNLTTLSNKITPHLKPYFLQLGVELTQLVITSVSLPDEVSAHFDKITNMNMVQDIDKFTKFTTAAAISQQGTVANQVVQNAALISGLFNKQNQAQPTAVAPIDLTVKLQQLKNLFDNNLINEQEYTQKKADLLNQL